jgi:predicted alpha/beta superfamily hydrolase
MKYMTAIVASMLTVGAQAQYTVKITLKELPSRPLAEVVYIAGNFNNWNPKDENFRLQKNEKGLFFIEIKDVESADYEFKFTRGSWDQGETNDKGTDLPNRKVTIRSDSSFQFSIAGWKDGFSQTPKVSTASARVKIIDTAFAMPQLGRTRRIWVYLPAAYSASTAKRYPVLYMHDGQNLFDNSTAFAGEWGVDEALDSIKNACIVVGIDNGGAKRMNEYNPNDTQQFGKGEGRAYLEFIVQTLKPFIDRQYRTFADKQHTYMAGSSMGGLITFYAGLYYPAVFGRLGVFSPSFWIEPLIKTQTTQFAKKTTHGSQKYYFYAGGGEGQQMAPDMKAVAAILKQAAQPALITVVKPEGKHNEISWSAVFPDFFKWIQN